MLRFGFSTLLQWRESLMSYMLFAFLFLSGTRPFQFQDVFSLENEDSEDMTTLIDKKVS